MIEYDIGSWGIYFIFQLRGSVFPKAFWLAFMNSIITGSVHYLLTEKCHECELRPGSNVNAVHVWSAYNWVLGFLIIFRTQQAYSKFWEGGTLLQQVRGEWINATSSLFAFCTNDPAKASKVEEMQHLVIRLMSMLYCAALQQVAVMKDEQFDIIDNVGIDVKSLTYLESKEDKCEVLIMWVQRLIHESMVEGLCTGAPPIMSRVFHDLSKGIVNVQNARKIAEFVFPFPYAQMISVMLIFQWAMVPIITISIVEAWWSAMTLSFLGVFTFWSINFIAMELEMPYGDDPNDLPIATMMQDFNYSLRTLMEQEAQVIPRFSFIPEHRECTVRPWTEDLPPQISARRPSDAQNMANVANAFRARVNMLKPKGDDGSSHSTPRRQEEGDEAQDDKDSWTKSSSLKAFSKKKGMAARVAQDRPVLTDRSSFLAAASALSQARRDESSDAGNSAAGGSNVGGFAAGGGGGVGGEGGAGGQAAPPGVVEVGGGGGAGAGGSHEPSLAIGIASGAPAATGTSPAPGAGAGASAPGGLAAAVSLLSSSRPADGGPDTTDRKDEVDVAFRRGDDSFDDCGRQLRDLAMMHQLHQAPSSSPIHSVNP